MKEYVFYDTDMRGEADYDICGSDYEKLIDVCCQYGCTLSLMIAKYSLQGTTQGRYLTGGVPPVRFSM